MKPQLDWSAYQDAGTGDAYADIPKTGGDFARAISVCINSRQCEKDTQSNPKGVMCPSFRVTNKPLLSTGGRIRLLKQILNQSEDKQPTWLTPELMESMELCVACKGCKRECENEVDMAMLKSEYLAQVQLIQPPINAIGVLFSSQGRRRIRNYLFANLSNNLYQFRHFTSILSWLNRYPFLSNGLEKIFAIDAYHLLPEPRLKAYFFEPNKKPKSNRSKNILTSSINPQPAKNYHSQIVLLLDTFSHNFDPEIAEAAIKVLNHGGYFVHLTLPPNQEQRPLCCGRTHIAHGMIDRAKQEAKRMLSVLYPHIQAGRKIIGLEPACLLAIRDDYLFLGLGEQAQQVANNALLFEEFIAKENTAKRFQGNFQSIAKSSTNTPITPPVLVHGHCHQKAVGAMKSMRKVLKMIPELKFQFIDTSCCGMAGSFGMESEHYEISQQMAEQSLLPTIRANTDAEIIANGFSCRHQIKTGSQRDAIHIAQLLQKALPMQE